MVADAIGAPSWTSGCRKAQTAHHPLAVRLPRASNSDLCGKKLVDKARVQTIIGIITGSVGITWGGGVRLTAKSEYGLLAMIELACRYGEGPASAREIAERRGIPARFLEQLFVALRRAELVTAVRGARGGFVLARDPRHVTTLDVVEALEGPLTASVCDTDRGLECGHAGACAAAPVWARATAALRDVFAATTLAELAGVQIGLDASSDAGE